MGRLLILAMLLAPHLAAQAVVNPAQLTPSLMDFEGPLPGPALACEVMPIRPMLNFSFRFSAGYVVRVPMSQYLGPGHIWAVLARITPEGGSRRPVYLGSRMRLPEIPRTKTQMEFGGAYVLGEGRYRASLKMWDDAGRVCRKSWTIDARRTHAERLVKVALPPDTVADLSLRGAPAPPARDDATRINLTILMHAAPVSPRRARLSGRDRMMLLSTLSSLIDRVPVQSVRLIVFNLDQQKELYREENFSRQSLNQVAQSIDTVQLGTVDLQVLENRGGHVDLLTGLIRNELDATKPSDVVLFLGPMSRFVDKVPAEELEKPAGPGPRFVYLQYRSMFPQAAVLPDVITRAVAKMKGKTIIIRSPGDFAKAIAEVERN